MRTALTLLLLAPAMLAAQKTVTIPGTAHLEIRSTDTSQVLTASLSTFGTLFGGVGVLRPSNGVVRCDSDGCTATTPSEMQLSLDNGEVRLTVPPTAAELEVTVIPSNSPSQLIVARGHKLKFSRDNFGELRIQAQSIKR